MKTYEQIQTEKLRNIEKQLFITNDLLKDISKTAMESVKLLYQLKIELETAKKEKEERQMIKDSGERTEFSTGAVRDMKRGVGRMDLLPWYGIMEVSKHCEEGAEKYGEHNVDKGIPLHSLCDSAARHLAKFIAGETDEDHLRAACWNLLWALNQCKTHPELDDLYSHKEKVEKVRNVIEELQKVNENGEVVFEDSETPATKSLPIRLCETCIWHDKETDACTSKKPCYPDKKNGLLTQYVTIQLTFAELIARHGERVFAEEYFKLDKIYKGWVTVAPDYEKNEIHLCPDLSKPNEWFYYDEGFVKCYDVNPYTGQKEE